MNCFCSFVEVILNALRLIFTMRVPHLSHTMAHGNCFKEGSGFFYYQDDFEEQYPELKNGGYFCRYL